MPSSWCCSWSISWTAAPLVDRPASGGVRSTARRSSRRYPTTPAAIEGQLRLCLARASETCSRSRASAGRRSTRRRWPRAWPSLDEVESLCDELCRPRRWLHDDGASSGRTALWRFALRLRARALSARALRPPLAEPASDRCTSRSANGLEADTRPGPPRSPASWPSISSAAAIDAAPSRTSSKPRGGRTTGSPTAKRFVSLRPALRLLEELPDTPERARDELRLRPLYTVGLSQTAGYERPRLLENLTRTQALCRAAWGPRRALRRPLRALPDARDGRRPRDRGGDGSSDPRLAHRVDASAALQAHFLRRPAPCGWETMAGGSVPDPALRSTVSVEAAARPYAVNPVIGAVPSTASGGGSPGRGGARNVQRDAVGWPRRSAIPTRSRRP